MSLTGNLGEMQRSLEPMTVLPHSAWLPRASSAKKNMFGWHSVVALRELAQEVAEKYTKGKFWKGLGKYQTHRLMQKFKELFSKDAETIKVLNGVSLMTPENIHLNAFMYEPILDMSDSHLKKLYKEICDLK